MLRFCHFFLYLISFFYASNIFALESNWSGIDEAKVRIISPISQTGDKQSIFLGLGRAGTHGWRRKELNLNIVKLVV